MDTQHRTRLLARPARPATRRPCDQARWQEIQVITRLGTAAMAANGLPALFDSAYESLRSHLDLSYCVAGLVEEASGQVRYYVPHMLGRKRSLPSDSLFDPSSLAVYIVAHGEARMSPWSPGEDGPAPHFLAGDMTCPAGFIGVPLCSGERVIGVLLAGSQLARAYGSGALRLLEMCAGTISLAVEKTRLFDAAVRHARSLEESVVARTAELQREKTRFESTVQSLSEGLLLLDLQLTISFANDRAVSLLGVPLEVMLGQPAALLWRETGLRLGDSDEFARQFNAALQQVADSHSFIVAVPPHVGSAADDEGAHRPPVRELQLTLFPVRDPNDQLLGRGLVLQDITHLRETDRMKDELINVVSHELRTPLASVLGFAELLLSRDFPESKRRQLLETIYQDAERLTHLVNDFLDLRRLEHGRQALNLREVALPEVVQAAAANFVLSQPRHHLVFDWPAGLPRVRADADQLGHVLLNLLGNAFKYSPRGGTVTVAARPAGDLVCVSVHDEGLGLPAEVIPQLFRSFFRVDSSDRREIGGTGLGLAIVKKIITAHGGSVWAESPGLGQGSTFGFTLPVAPAAEAGPAAPVARAAGQTRRPSGPYVLAFEPDAGLRNLLSEHLRAAGYTTEAANGLEEALGLVQRRLPLAVIVDVPAAEPEAGWALVQGLRQRCPGEILPIIVTSVLDEPAKARALGATEYLAKPYDARQVVALIRQRPMREVLVVEDDEMISHLMCSVLSKVGFRGRSTGTGLEALASLERGLPDLLLLDLMLPGMNGFEVLEQLRAMPDGRTVPVVVVTAKQLTEADDARLLHNGAFLLTKGDYSAVRLRTAMERALREKWATTKTDIA